MELAVARHVEDLPGTIYFPLRFTRQQDVQRAQAELNERDFTASSGGGMVTVTVNGAKDVKSIVINPACVDPDDVEMLQDLVLSAVNEALRTATKTIEDEIGKITGGLGLGL